MSKGVAMNGDSSERKSISENNSVGKLRRQSTDKDIGLPVCRVCQCAESDKRGDIALNFLGIAPPLSKSCDKSDDQLNSSTCQGVKEDVDKDASSANGNGEESRFVEFISPDGEVFICSSDIETGSCNQLASLIKLGCSCKNDMALVHYSCALKWFINHGSTICEICGCLAKNMRISDFNKVISSLRDYDALMERMGSGESASEHASMNVDPDAVVAIRRLRLREISLWFGPLTNNSLSAMSHVVVEQIANMLAEQARPVEHPAKKWAVEFIGVLLVTGLLTVTLAWLIAPRVGEKAANSGLHILIGGACILTVVIFFRFVVLTRVKYGPAHYWAILFVFWFLVFGIWASRSHNSHDS